MLVEPPPNPETGLFPEGPVRAVLLMGEVCIDSDCIDQDDFAIEFVVHDGGGRTIEDIRKLGTALFWEHEGGD